MLRAVAPGLTVAAGLGILALAAALIRRPRRWYAVPAGLVAVVLALTPMLAGYDLHTLRVWFPDAATALFVAVTAWALVALLLLRQPRRDPEARP